MFYVIDASIYVFRAWYSIPDDMQDGDGNPVNALYGFTRFLGDFLEHTRPEHVAVAFDNSLATCFRNEIYPPYKDGTGIEQALLDQFPLAERAMRAIGVTVWSMYDYEADDALATGARRWVDDVDEVVDTGGHAR